VEKARLLYKAGRYDEAIGYFEAALRANPTDAVSMRGMARCYMAKGQEVQAVTWAESAAQHDTTPDAWVLLGEIHLDLGKAAAATTSGRSPLTPVQLRHVQKALECGREALKIQPECGAGFRVIADATARLGDLPAAEGSIRRALELEPESRLTRFVAADLFRRDGKLEAALEHARYLVETLQARDRKSLSLASEIYVDLKRYDEAIPLIKELIRRGEDEASARVAMAYCYLATGDHEQAVAQADRAERIAGRAVPAELYQVRGQALFRLRRYERAIVDFRQLATADKGKKDATSRFMLGKSYLASGERELARDAFLEAAQIQPAHLEAHEELAKLLAAEGSLVQAAAELRKAVDAAPDRPEASQRLVSFCLDHGLHDEAERELHRLLGLRPRAPDLLALLARLQLDRGEAELALPLAHDALRLQPGDVQILHLVARAHSAAGNGQMAAAYFAEVVRRDPKLLQAYLDWAALHERGGQRTEAQQVYDQARKALPDSSALRCAYARFCLATGRRDEGIGELRAVLRQDPRDLSARVALVECFLTLGESDTALAEARQGAQIMPESVPAQALLARVHRTRGEWAQFVAILDGVAAHLDKDAFVAYQRLAAHVHELRFGDALEVGKDALKRFPGRRRAIQLDLAIATFFDRRRNEGLEAARQLVGLDARDCDAGFAVSLMALINEEPTTQIPACSQDALPEIALAAWRDLANLNERRPDRARVVANALLEILVYDNAGWHDVAAERCEKILELQADCLIARSLLPVLWERAGRRDKAIAACQRLIEKAPGFARAKMLLGDLLLLDGKADRAKALYAETARADPPDLDAVTKQALFATLGGDSAAAANAWRGLLAQSSHLVLAYNNLAWALATQPEPKLDEALELATVAQNLAPEAPAILDTLGWVHHQLGQDEEAIQRLEAAVKGAPYRGLYYFHLGMAYARRHEDAKADEALRRAIELDPDGLFVEQARQTLTNLHD